MSKKQFLAFLESIDAAKLENFPPSRGRLFPIPLKEGDNYRLDKQNEGLTDEGYHNLQIQPKRKKAASTAPGASSKPDTSEATVLVLEGSDPPVGPEEVRKAFQDSYEGGNEVIKLGTKPAPPEGEAEAPKDQPAKKGKGKGKQKG